MIVAHIKLADDLPNGDKASIIKPRVGCHAAGLIDWRGLQVERATSGFNAEKT